ncbi:MAG TPA: hypothetical protein VF615_14130 [Longimicrobiaceae bacterium]
MTGAALDAAVERALGWLHRVQLPSGEFRSYLSTDHSLERDRVFDSSPFPTALIAYSLGFAGGARAREMLGRAVEFFLAEMEPPGVWRYWTREHRHRSTIPADLDDLACVSYVLRREGASFPDNRELALAARNPAGLFYTWLAPRWPAPRSRAYWRVALRHWRNPARAYYFWKLNESGLDDVDCVVNANVLLYLGEGPDTAAVAGYLADVFRSGGEACCDKWHLNPFTFQYVVSRCFAAGAAALGAVRDQAVARIAAAAGPDGRIGDNELDTALAACALLSWGCAPPELERAVGYLLAAQRPEGDWRAASLYFGGPKKYFGWGSEELTTGFAVEALARYRDSAAAPPRGAPRG